jgi:hypothetical protein
VFNNITTLFVLLAIAIVLSAVLLLRERPVEPMEWALLFSGVVVWAAALVIFVKARGTFLEKAHYTAAIAMFACIVAVVVLNALGFHDKQQRQGEQPRHPFTNRYAVIAGLMVASAGAIGIWDWTVGWDHAVLFIEGALITLFAVFWLMQTEELWEGGVRRT